MGISSFLAKLFGSKAQRDMREIQPYVEKVRGFASEMEQLSNDELRARTAGIREKVRNYVATEVARIAELRAMIDGQDIEERERTFDEIDRLDKVVIEKYEEVLEEVLPEVFAIVRDTARRFSSSETIEVTATEMDRDLAASHDFVEIDGDKAIYHNHWVAGGNDLTWNMEHYDVQVFGGVVLHKGKIAEMATGEGKTLVATLPVFLNALTGNGVHVITVNDYLSKRDSEWMGPLYMFHGLTVDCIDKHRPNSPERRKAYMADITFGTNNEFGFDYLRDNMATHPEDLVQRRHNFAIVDEVDSVLIDDARTPLIISGPIPKGDEQMFDQFCPRVEKLVSLQRTMATNYLVEAKELLKSADKKEQEAGALALFRSYKALPKNTPLIKFLSEQGNKSILLATEEYYMAEQNRNMHIATDPLYFVIDEKNRSVELTDKGVAALTGASDDPEFFVLPDITTQLSQLDKDSMSKEEYQATKDELMQNYSVKMERVHTVTQLLKAYALFEKDQEYVIIDNKVKIVDEQTGRIMEGRRYSDGLHQAIEAKERVKVEAATQTFATITLQNYFRMYHKLAGMTGTAETEAGEFWNIYKLDVVVIPTNKKVERIDMNDRVYRTMKEKYNAVINEICDLVEAGRPVLVGTSSVEISEKLSKMLSLRKIEHSVLNAKLHQKEADIVAKAGLGKTVTIATNMAGRGTDIKLSDEVKAAGGLAIIGTERHESRRVDRQLRGRAGRQGDPGSSVFFVSLEDNLMRLFATEKAFKVVDKLGIFKEGEVIEDKMITNAIERAQKRVEENHFGVRKRLLEYDDVMNAQREVIYKKRRQTLLGERLGVNIMNMLYDSCISIIEECRETSDFENLEEQVLVMFAIDTPITEDEFKQKKDEELVEILFRAALDAFKRKMDHIAEVAFPVIKKVYEDQGDRIERIIVPITDGKRMYNIPVNFKAAYESECKEVVKVFEKMILLHVFDENWKDHLREMDELRNSVQNAVYEQKDPLLIYKRESYGLFKKMIENINKEAIAILMRGQIPVQERSQEEVREAAPEKRENTSYQTNRTEEARQPQPQPQRRVVSPITIGPKIGRNDPCPCGSGKKYKHCHGK